MAASVCCSLVLFLFLFVCPVLSNDFPISFTRNELLDIRNSTPDNLLPTFEHSDVLLGILVGGAAFLFKSSRRRKRGKRAGALVKTRQRGLRTSLPSIHLANLRSLVKRWTAEAEQDLQACFELTDWSVFEAAATDLDELTDTVTSYISFCEDMCVPTRTYLTFNNDKPWFSTKLKQLRLAKEDAYRSGEKALYKQAKYTLNREIRVAKKNYTEKLKKTAFK